MDNDGPRGGLQNRSGSHENSATGLVSKLIITFGHVTGDRKAVCRGDTDQVQLDTNIKHHRSDFVSGSIRDRDFK